MIEIDGQKETLRKKAKEKVAMLPEEYCTRADEQIFRYAVSLPEYQDAETIFCYVGTKREINTMLIMQDAWKSGKKLVLPKELWKYTKSSVRMIYKMVPMGYWNRKKAVRVSSQRKLIWHLYHA